MNEDIKRLVEADLFDGAAFGDRLRGALEKAGLSYRKAEPVIGVSYATLQRVAEAVKPPNVENYLRIERWLSKEANPHG